MEIEKKLILHLEKLSKLALSELEREKLMGDLTETLKMIDKLKEVDTTDVEPLIYMNESPQSVREDVNSNQLSRASALKNAPLLDETYFKVPKVIDL